MDVTEAQDGVKVYNLSTGKSMQEWLAEYGGSRNRLKRSSAFKQRIELLQEAEFPTACSKLRVTGDGRHLVGIGTYAPRIKWWQLDELSVQMNRFIDHEAADFTMLGNDWTKAAVLRLDRYVEFHARHGCHFKTRVPKYCRALAYEAGTCDLLVVGSSSQAYRINLDQGRFLAPFETDLTEINTVAVNAHHSLVALGGTNGVVEAWDARDRRRCGALRVALSGEAAEARRTAAVTAFAFADDGLTFAVGTAQGRTALFDLRGRSPLLVKEQGNGDPIVSVSFHGVSRIDSDQLGVSARESRGALSAFAGAGPVVLSADRSLIKAWDRRSGETRVNIESEARLNQVLAYSPDSGLLFAASEQPKIQVFYVPLLGPAPRWCAFIDQMTEELEEERQERVFDDFKFVTRDELARLGLDNLLGTSYLRPYMHGFFVDVRLFSKMLAAVNPNAFDEQRKQRVRDKIEERRASRISVRRRPKVNADFARQLESDAAEAGAAAGAAYYNDRNAATADADADANANDDDDDDESANEEELIDRRFGDLFTNPDFEIDPSADAYRRVEKGRRLAREDAAAAAAATREPRMLALRGDSSSHAITTATAAAMRGGDAAARLRDDERARDAPLAERVAREPGALEPVRYEFEGTFDAAPQSKPKKKKTDSAAQAKRRRRRG